MARGISINNLSDSIAKELEFYNNEVTEEVKKSVREAATLCVKEVKKNAPVDSGGYKRGWTSKTEYESASDIRVSVYNKHYPQRTHLLEHGHAKVNGGRVEGKPHIAPAEEKAEKYLDGTVKIRIQG